VNDKKFSLGSIAALFLSLFFSIIVIFFIFSYLKINEYEAFPAVITFASINLIVIILMTSYGKLIVNKAGAATFIALCTITTIYTVFQFVYLALQYQDASAVGYILFNLIILFIFFLIVIPVGMIGTKNKN